MASQNPRFESSFDQVLHKRSDLHILRKLWHISTGSIGLFIFLRSSQDTFFWAVVILLISLSGFLMDIVRVRIPRLNHALLRVMGPIMRRSEKEGWSGLPFYALGTSLTLFFFQKEIAVLSIFFLVFADPVSSFFGVLYGKDKILPNKSLQGAVAGFFTCYLITLFYTVNSSVVGVHLLTFSILAGLIGVLTELVSAFNIDDNLSIPVLSGLGITLLNKVITVFP
jgi:diacylglycerol kinase (CTP)